MLQSESKQGMGSLNAQLAADIGSMVFDGSMVNEEFSTDLFARFSFSY